MASTVIHSSKGLNGTVPIALEGPASKRALTGNTVNEGTNNTNKKKPRTYISRLVVTLQECLAKLNARNVTPAKLERFAVIIHECMSSGSRNYHSVHHAFDISKNITDPIGIIAALFHDTIYYIVDGGLSNLQMEMLHGVFKLEEETEEKLSTQDAEQLKKVNPFRKPRRSVLNYDGWCVVHREGYCEKDPLLCMVAHIFGCTQKTDMNAKNGINEFLSAIVAVRQLEPHLTREQLAQIACCIEATIPFNHSNATQKHCVHSERLYQSMVETRDHFSLKLIEEELVKAIQLAVTIANADVGNFGSEDRYWFLDNTWSLLPETNTSLREQFLYTVCEYQEAVYKMYGFFNFLDPKDIFASFRGVPSDEQIANWTIQAERNLELGKKYVGAKLLSASVLAAFAQLTGGDAPICLFMGDLPTRHHESEKLEDSLPITDAENLKRGHCDMSVYAILSGGRKSETQFDTKSSPLAAYLYAELGDENLQALLKNKVMHPMDNEIAMKLLKSLPYKCVSFLTKIMAPMAVSRAEAILKLAKALPDNEDCCLSKDCETC